MSDFDARALLVKRLGEDYVRTLRAGCVRAGEDAHAAGFREGWETCICIIRKVSEEYHGTATERTSTDLCEERIRALLDQPDDRKEG